MNSLFVVFTHLLCFITECFAIWYDVTYIKVGHAKPTFGGRLKYLTFWCMCIQAAYFGLCVLVDLTGTPRSPNNREKRTFLQKSRDFFHATIAFPIGAFVVTMFWCIYAIDRELVYPKILDDIIPAWLNHIMHTTVLPFLLIEKHNVLHHYPSRWRGISMSFAFATLYLVWILFIAYYANIWVYPLLAVLNMVQMAVFFIFSFIVVSVFYLAGETLSKMLWAPHLAAKEK